MDPARGPQPGAVRSGASTPPPAPPPSRASRASSATLSGTSTPLRAPGPARPGSAGAGSSAGEEDEAAAGDRDADGVRGNETLVTDRGGSLQVVSLMQRLRPHAKDQQLARDGIPDGASGENTDQLNDAKDPGNGGGDPGSSARAAITGSASVLGMAPGLRAAVGLRGGGGSSPCADPSTPDNTPYYLSDDAGDSSQQRASERSGARPSKQNMLSAVQARLREIEAQQETLKQAVEEDEEDEHKNDRGSHGDRALAADGNAAAREGDDAAAVAARTGDAVDDEDEESQSSYASFNVDKLLELHDLYLIVQDEYFAARKALERDFREKFGTIFKRRAAVINGADDPEEAIPGFWYIALSHNRIVSDLFTDRDVEALDALEDIRCVDVPSSNDPNASQYGFRLEFHFRENRFFENRVLHKTYRVPNLFVDNTHPVLESIEGCLVVWKSHEVDLTRRRRVGGRGNVSGVESDDDALDEHESEAEEGDADQESFFAFFDAPWMEHAQNLSRDAYSEGEHQALLDQVAADFRAGYEIYSKIVPEALGWFTGEAAAEDDQDDEDDDDEEDDDDDNDDDEDDNEEAEHQTANDYGNVGSAQSTARRHVHSDQNEQEAATSGASDQTCKQQ